MQRNDAKRNEVQRNATKCNEVQKVGARLAPVAALRELANMVIS
jgi:hypothetical protein